MAKAMNIQTMKSSERLPTWAKEYVKSVNNMGNSTHGATVLQN
jgi:hypothetical protein